MKHLLVLVCFSVLLASVWFHDGLIKGTGESGLPFHNLNRQYEQTKYAWADTEIGYEMGQQVAGQPTYYVLSRLVDLGLSPWQVQWTFFVLCLISGSAGMAVLYSSLTRKKLDRFAMLAGMLYICNPITTVNVWNRFLNNFVTFWAFLPVLCFLLVNIFSRQNWLKYAALLGLGFYMYSYSFTSLPFVLITMGILCIFSFISFQKRSVSQTVGRLSVLIIIFIFVNIWWISQFITSYFSTQISTNIANYFRPEDNLQTFRELSNSLGNPLQLLTMSHTNFDTTELWWIKIYHAWPSVLITFGLVVFSIVVGQKTKKAELKLMYIFYLLCLIISAGAIPPFGTLFEFVFFHFPVLQIFRNPYEKFSFLQPLFLIPILAYGLNKISTNKILILDRLSYVFICALIWIWGFPVLLGLVFSNNINVKGVYQSYSVNVPEYYLNADRWLISRLKPGERFLSLPLSGEGLTYTWPRPYSGVELSALLFENPNLSFKTSNAFTKPITERLENVIVTDPKQAKNILNYLNIKYILLRSDIDWKYRSIKNPDEIRSILDNSEDYVKVVSFGQLDIYAIKNVDRNNIFYISPKPLVSTGPLSMDQVSLVIKNSDTFRVEPETSMADIVTPHTEREFRSNPYSLEEALSQLLYVSRLPDDRLYSLAKFRENVNLLFILNRDEKFIFELTHLGKYVVEIYKSKENPYALSVYKAKLMDLVSRYPEKFSANADQITKEVVWNELQKHRVVLSNAPEINENEVNNLMSELGFLPPEKVTVANFSKWQQFNVRSSGTYELLPMPKVFQINNLSFMNPDKTVSLQSGKIDVFVPIDTTEVLSEENIELKAKSQRSFDLSVLDQDATYFISFDYSFTKGKSFEVGMKYDNSVLKDGKTRFNWWKIAKRTETTSHFNYQFVNTPGASHAELVLDSADADVYVTNLHLYKRSSTSSILKKNIVEIHHNWEYPKWEKVSPVNYLVDTSNTESELLVFSQAYNSNWHLYADSMEIGNHFEINQYANAWVLPEGKYKFELRFTPQRLLDLGLTTSKIAVSVLVMMSLLLVAYEKVKKNK